MRKSQFLGISILNPGEGLDADNYAFSTRDRELIDFGIKVGATLHRHNAASGMADPTTAPSGVEVIASGGQIPTGVTISVGYTYEDAIGGETALSPTVAVTTGQPMSVPTVAPTATIDYASGALTVNTYYYAVSWLDGEGGETPIGPTVSVDRQPGYATAEITLSELNAGMEAAGATGWRLYRASGGGAYELLAEGTASDSEFVDDGVQAVNCDVHPVADESNNTLQNNTLSVVLPSAGPPATGADIETDAAFINLYASLGNDFAESSLLAQYPMASAGETVTFTALEFLPASPPDVNTSWGGANKIDPDTELIDWHWKRPVAELSELPTEAEVGDVRIVEELGGAFIFNEAKEWVPFASGPAVTASGTTVDPANEIEVLGSGGVTVRESEPTSGKAQITIDGDAALLANEAMGVLVLKTSEKGMARPTRFKQYTWFCKEKPTNMAEFDIWIEAGP